MKTPPADLARRLVGMSEQILRPDRELRLEDVAALAGAARATLYYYFSGRDDLIAFILEEHLAAAADAVGAAVPPGEPADTRLHAAVAALIEFLGLRPGVCAGLLSFAGAAGRMAVLLTAKDTMLAAPLRTIITDGAEAGLFVTDDPRDATNAILGAVMITILDRWHRGDDTTAAGFQQALTDQIVRGLRAA